MHCSTYDRKDMIYMECTVDGCSNELFGMGMCVDHVSHWQEYGNTDLPGPRLCDVEGCDRRHYAKGWCELHWARMYRNGTLVPKKRGRKPKVKV